MQLSDDEFYDENKIAIMPMGLCYPGKGKSGDMPPRKKCAPQWHQKVFEHLSDLKLILLIGQYAQKSYLNDNYKTLTERVVHATEAKAPFFRSRIRHPETRSRLKKNPWFRKHGAA